MNRVRRKGFKKAKNTSVTCHGRHKGKKKPPRGENVVFLSYRNKQGQTGEKVKKS